MNSKGAILPPKDVDPNSTQNAKLAMEAARDNAEVSILVYHFHPDEKREHDPSEDHDFADFINEIASVCSV